MKAKRRDSISRNNQVATLAIVFVVQLKSTTKWKSHLGLFLEK